MNTRTLTFAVLFCFAFQLAASMAADVTSIWDGSTNNWSDASHWDSVLFPNNGNGGLTYDAVISNGIVTVDQAIEIEGLNQTGGMIDGMSDLTASELTTWTGGTMAGAGTTHANGGMVLSGGFTKSLDGHVLNNAGAATWTGGQFLTGNGATFNNQLGATFDTNFNGSFWNAIGGVQSQFNNAGTFIKSGGTGGATQIDIPFHNTGAVEVNSRQLSFRGGGTSNGSFTGMVGTTLDFSGETYDFSTGSSVTSAGTVQIGSGTWNFNDGTFDVSGTTSVTGGTANFSTTPTINQLNLSAGTLGGTADIPVSGMLTWTGGTMSGVGTTHANGGINLSGNSPKNLNGRTLNNSGATTWSSGAFVTGNGAIFNNLAGATFETDVDRGLFNGVGGAQSQFNNAGTFIKSGGTGGATQIDIPFHNTGAVEVNSGQLSFRGGGASNGGFAGMVGTTLDFRGETYDFSTGSSVTSAGTFQIGSGTWNLNDGTFDVSGTTLVTGGTANFYTTPTTINQLNLSAGTLGGTADIPVSGMLTWTGGTMSGLGTTHANGGINLSGNSPKNLNGRTLNNSGATTWTGGQFLTGNGATFNNQLGATFDTNFNGDFWNAIGGAQSQFNNAGTFTKNGGTGTSYFGVEFNNTGTVNVNSGTLKLSGGGVNTGSMNVLGAILEIDNAYTNEGHMLVDSVGEVIGQLNVANTVPSFANPGTLEVRDGIASIAKTSSINVVQFEDPMVPGVATITEGTWIAGANGSIAFEQLIISGSDAWLRHNNAVVVLDGPSSHISMIDGLWTNSGTFEIRGGRDILLTGKPGDLVIAIPDSPVENTGTIRVGVGSTLMLGLNGISNGNGSRLEGEGVIEGSVSAHGTMFSSNGTLSINQGSLSISTSVSTLTAGTLAVNVPMYVNNGGHFVIADGATLGGSGILELQDGLVTIDGTLNKQVRIVGPVKVGGTISDATLDGAVVTTSMSGGGFGLVNCFGENTIESGVVNINGQLLVNDGTLTLGAGASIFGPGAIDVKALASAVVFGNVASTGNATITGSLAVEAGATAQAANWHVIAKSLVKVTGKIKSPNPATVAGTLLVKMGGEVDIPNVKITGDLAKLIGSGKVKGNVTSGSNTTFSPGQSPGTLTVGGNMTFEGASTLEFEVRDAQGTSGVDYDLLVVESDLINIGTVADPMTISLHTLDLLDEAGQATNFDNSQDYTWTIATAVGSINGFLAGTYVFDESAFLNDIGSGAFLLSIGDAGHALNVVFSANGLPTVETGDFDLDGDVDGRDFLVWQRNPGVGDLVNWQANYGAPAVLTASSRAVPEPSSLTLGVFGSSTLLMRRRRKKPSVFKNSLFRISHFLLQK